MQLILQRNRTDSEAIEVIFEHDNKNIVLGIWDEGVLDDDVYMELEKNGEVIMNLEIVK